MEKEYIPSRHKCYFCGMNKPRDDDGMSPWSAVGFRSKAHRWVFCGDCFERWMNWTEINNDRKCPRQKIFKVVAGKEPKPYPFKRGDEWLLEMAALPKIT